MEKTIVLVLLCTAATGQIGQHVFISTPKTWPDAQSYCRRHYTDLSFVVSQSDQDGLLEAAGDNCPRGWIGLHRRRDNMTAWMWSGGADVTYQNWANGQPGNYMKHAVFVRYDGRWKNADENNMLPFYCTRTPTMRMRMRMTWEEALEYCRNNNTDLPSVLTEAELRQYQTVIQLDSLTEPVWIGLRYLNGWVWVNGKPLVYSGWPQGDQDHACPALKRCAALSKTEEWDNCDCEERLNFICI